jgi:hypothetical protein
MLKREEAIENIKEVIDRVKLFAYAHPHWNYQVDQLEKVLEFLES